MIYVCINIIIIIWLYIISWKNKKSTVLFPERFLIFGHRGAPEICPENTIESFLQAINDNADGIELDVQFTKDKKIIIHHDYNIGIRKKVRELTFNEINKINQTRICEIPTLDRIEKILHKVKFLNIEIKTETLFSENIEENIAEFLIRNQIENKTIVSSFNPIVLKKIKKINKKIFIGHLYSKEGVPWYLKTKLWVYYSRPNSFHPDIKYINENIINWAKRKNMRIFVFTINTKEELKKVKKFKVNGLFTDNPAKIKSYIQKEELF